ncbi:hypothetical protein [Prauserella flavalba]|uniref:hypothetical protein n=1 Tax=Prauserella flavalba TaxID=1477506 RepID=UPI0036E8D870
MAKEIRGHAMPDPKVYVPTPQDPEPNQSGGTVPWASQGGGSGPNQGPGFAFDAEQLGRMAETWENLAERFRNASRNARLLMEANGAGSEYASAGNAEMIRSSGKALLETLEERMKYCQTMADKFSDAGAAYGTAEEGATTEVRKHGGKY